jgi:hypothetical protein
VKTALCDCLVIWYRNSKIIAVELKGGAGDATRSIEQIRGGAKFIEEQEIDLSSVSFIPLIATGKGDKFEIRQISEATVRYRGRNIPIERVKCGASLDTY